MAVIHTTPENTLVLSTWFAEEIAKELADPDYLNRTHGTRSCINSGCLGPLCSKTNRDIARAKYHRRNPNARTTLGPEDPERDAFLESLIQAHKEARGHISREVA